MQPKLLKLGTALTAVALSLNAMTAPAAAGGYDGNAALINTYIQSAPWTSYGDYGGYGGWSDPGYITYKPWSGVSYYYHGYKPWHDPGHYTSYKPWSGTSYDTTPGHGTVSYYDDYGDAYYYGDPAFAKITTIVSPNVGYDDYNHVRTAYIDDHVLHVRKHATDVRNPVFFEFGSSMLSYPAKHELDQIGQIISAYYFDNPKVLILLSGFTDATGSQSANEVLAMARNQAVRDYLIAQFGFDKTRFVLRAVGEEYANMSAMPYGDNQRKVTVSLIGLPKSATDTGHEHPHPAMHGNAMVPGQTHETTDAAPAMAADKGEIEMSPAEGEGMAMAPAPKPVPTPAPVVVAEHQPAMVDHGTPGSRCIVPSGPYSGTYVDGKVLATMFTDIDDYGGGKLVEVCGLSY